MSSVLFSRLSAFCFALVLLAACTQRAQPPKYETISCNDKCVIVFRPDSATVRKFLAESKDTAFAKALERQKQYTEDLKESLKGGDIRLLVTESRFIAVQSGARQRYFEARDDDGYPLGVILSRPDAEPMIHFGLFTNLDYVDMLSTYFK